MTAFISARLATAPRRIATATEACGRRFGVLSRTTISSTTREKSPCAERFFAPSRVGHRRDAALERLHRMASAETMRSTAARSGPPHAARWGLTYPPSRERCIMSLDGGRPRATRPPAPASCRSHSTVSWLHADSVPRPIAAVTALWRRVRERIRLSRTFTQVSTHSNVYVRRPVPISAVDATVQVVVRAQRAGTRGNIPCITKRPARPPSSP